MQINSTGSGCAFFWRFWRFFKQVSPLKRTLPSSHGVYSAGSILLWSVEIQQFSLLGSSNLLESSLDAVTPLLGSHVTIHNVTGNIEDGMVAACNAKSDEEIGLKINDTSPDELGFLARTIDNMVNEIGLLAQRWSDDQRKMRELELQTLQYQINPHFLFNTLNTLKWIATLNHVTPVSHGIDALSSLLQSTLIKKDELIPFDDELRNLKNYCDIQQLRYAGRFEMEYQIEDAAGYWTVPRFILQPLVENSILHGTADEDDFVTITVRATVSENLLTIHISDTGCGFDPSAIKEKNSERFSGIGLSNVDERMRLHYGNEYGLTIESAPGIGTQCILCIPNEAIR